MKPKKLSGGQFDESRAALHQLTLLSGGEHSNAVLSSIAFQSLSIIKPPTFPLLLLGARFPLNMCVCDTLCVQGAGGKTLLEAQRSQAIESKT